MVRKLFQHYLLNNLTVYRDLENYHINFFFFFAMPCGFRNLVPQPGMEPRPPAVEAPSPNHWKVKLLSPVQLFATP